MSYVLIPEGSKLKKVTEPQKKAVDAYNRHENINTFLGNEATPKLIIGAALLASLPKILSIILPLLAKQIPGIPSDAAELIDQTIFIKDLNEAIGEIIVPGGGILFKGETRDFWDKYVKK